MEPDSNKRLLAEHNENYEEKIHEELSSARQELAQDGGADSINSLEESWETAARIVERVQPVPWPFWIMTRSVFGNDRKMAEVDYVNFQRADYLLFRAVADETLSNVSSANLHQAILEPSLEDVVKLLGSDVCGALILIHAACRRVAKVLPPIVWRPIVEEALIRAELGYRLGKVAARFGPGKGILAGFSTRAGLIVQFASGDINDAQQALELLATGEDIQNVGRIVYACDPLQVSAMTLVAGGCGLSASFGTAAFGSGVKVPHNSSSLEWFSAFTIIELLRMSQAESITESDWSRLNLDSSHRKQLYEQSQELLRRGHSWEWVLASPDLGDIRDWGEPPLPRKRS